MREGTGVECLRKASLMSRCKSKDMKKLKLQIVGIFRDLREGCSRQRISANTMIYPSMCM